MKRIFFLLVSLIVLNLAAATIYNATWASIDSRPLPKWFDEAKFGIVNHWGVYSAHGLPCFFLRDWGKKKYAIDYMRKNFPPNFTYAEFGPQFKAEYFDVVEFAKVIKASGAKYYVLTSKFFDGYAMYPSKYSWNWNSVDVGPHRDFVGELQIALKKLGGMRFGIYFYHADYTNPIFLQDQKNEYKTNDYVATVSQPQLREIVSLYKPDLIWSNGYGIPYPTADYWNSTHFLAWLYNSRSSSTAQWATIEGIDPIKMWSWRPTMVPSELRPTADILFALARTVSYGGNMFLNVGPTGYGRIEPIFVERLTQIGDWLRTNGEAIYATKPWIHQNDTAQKIVWYTSKVRNDHGLESDRIFNPQIEKNTIVYAIVMKWPEDGIVKLKQVKITAQTKVNLLGHGKVSFKPHGDSIEVFLNTIPWNKLPSLYAWVIKMEYLQDDNNLPLVFEEWEQKLENDDDPF